ncbi:MAG TPA: DUF1289 domain-containing protein [Rhizomicrobium sp.]|jgi:predicted Fe-S protein YdhL (DUF1289 family)|nr:DUF1289 domain-containing protein [Rhizomicrobium sp.]
MAIIETPCRKICVMDPASGLCTGCGRTLDEIARWAIYPPEVRHRVMAELPERMKRFQRKTELPEPL